MASEKHKRPFNNTSDNFASINHFDTIDQHVVMYNPITNDKKHNKQTFKRTGQMMI